MKNLRKDATTGIALIIAWAIIKIIFKGEGLFLWLLGAAGVVLLIVGILPEEIHSKVLGLWNKVFKKQ